MYDLKENVITRMARSNVNILDRFVVTVGYKINFRSKEQTAQFGLPE